MLLILGYIIGVLNSLIVILLFIYFKKPLITISEKAVTKIDSFLPGGRGYIFEPEEENVEIRKDIISKNSKLGKFTKLKDLP